MDGHPVTGIGHDHFLTRRYQQGVNSGLSILNAFLPSLEEQMPGACLAHRHSRHRSDSRPTWAPSPASLQQRAQDYRGGRVVIAAGGCAANPRLFEELHDVPYATTAYPTSLGDGLILGMSSGGAIVGGEKYTSLPGLIPEVLKCSPGRFLIPR